MFEKNLNIGYLLDFYGELLSERKRSVMDMYYNEDLSLAEISAEIGITRQGTRDIIKKTEEELLFFEEKLGLENWLYDEDRWPSGSAGGHNGLKSIIRHLGGDNFPRVKVGVGIPQQEGYDTVDWVIGKPRGEDEKAIIAALDKAVAAIPYLIDHGAAEAMNKFNG